MTSGERGFKVFGSIVAIDCASSAMMCRD
jgi:hypothetical protein